MTIGGNMINDDNCKYRIDLHVHTPASHDYQGPKNSDEFYSLITRASNTKSENKSLESASTDGLKLIAITDHNSVDGFIELIRIKRECSELVHKIKQYSQNVDVINDLQEKEKVFANIHILMGVEVSTEIGVHLLIIFREDVANESVISFLEDGIGKSYSEFNGLPEPLLKWDIPETMNEVFARFGSKAFVVAPHADSNKGIYESLKGLPQPRIAAFKHSMLKAISFNNPDNREKMKHLLKSKDYKRESAVVFIQSSDYHGLSSNDIGSLSTIVKFDTHKLSYDTLFIALGDEKNITCSVDIIKDIYNEIVENRTVIKFNSASNNTIEVSDSDYRSLADSVCGLLNSGRGAIELSASNIDFEQRNNIINNFTSEFIKIVNTRIKPNIANIKIKALPVSNSKLTVLAIITKSNKLHASDGRIYLIRNGNVQEADINDIEYTVTKNICNRFGLRCSMELNEMSSEVKRLAKTYDAYPIAIRTDDKLSFGLNKNFELVRNDRSENYDELSVIISKHPNGTSNGSLYILPAGYHHPRQDDSYLRFSAPMYDHDEATKFDKLEFDTLFVMPGGGLFIAETGKHISYTKSATLIAKEEVDIYKYLAWFKSSFFLWYCTIVLGNKDLYILSLFDGKSIPLPINSILDDFEPATILCKKIIQKEIVFLAELQNDKLVADDDKHNKLIVDFNEEMNELNNSLDEAVFKSLDITEYEIEQINDALSELKIHTFK